MKHSLPELPGQGPAIQLAQISSWRTNMFGGRVIVSADLSLDRHASAVSVRASSFYWFCQLDESIAHWIFSQLRHMYMPSRCTCRLDYCNLVLAGWSKTARVMNTGAPVLRSTPALSRWVTVARCGRLGHIQAQPNSVQVCSWPSTSHQTTCLSFVPEFQLEPSRLTATGLPTRNSLCDDLRDPDVNIAAYQCTLKTFLFQQYSVH